MHVFSFEIDFTHRFIAIVTSPSNLIEELACDNGYTLVKNYTVYLK